MVKLVKTVKEETLKRIIEDDDGTVYTLNLAEKDKCSIQRQKEGKTFEGSLCKIKEYIPNHKDVFGEKENFYVGTDVIIKETIPAAESAEPAYTIFKKEEIDLVSILLSRKLFNFKKLEEPKNEIIGNLERGYTTDPYWIDSHSMCSGENIEDIVNLINPHITYCLPPDSLDVYVEFPHSGTGFAGAVEARNNKQIDDQKKKKRRISITKNSQKKLNIKDPNDFKGDLRSKDKIALIDDVGGRRTIPHVAKRLIDNEFMKGRVPPVQDLKIVGFYTIIDSQRRENNDYSRKHFCMPGYTFTSIQRIADILYAKGNGLFKWNPYKNEDIDLIKPEIETYLTVECNCKKEDAYDPVAEASA